MLAHTELTLDSFGSTEPNQTESVILFDSWLYQWPLGSTQGQYKSLWQHTDGKTQPLQIGCSNPHQQRAIAAKIPNLLNKLTDLLPG